MMWWKVTDSRWSPGATFTRKARTSRSSARSKGRVAASVTSLSASSSAERPSEALAVKTGRSTSACSRTNCSGLPSGPARNPARRTSCRCTTKLRARRKAATSSWPRSRTAAGMLLTPSPGFKRSSTQNPRWAAVIGQELRSSRTGMPVWGFCARFSRSLASSSSRFSGESPARRPSRPAMQCAPSIQKFFFRLKFSHVLVAQVRRHTSGKRRQEIATV